VGPGERGKWKFDGGKIRERKKKRKRERKSKAIFGSLGRNSP
jgi:hypothetical protein